MFTRIPRRPVEMRSKPTLGTQLNRHSEAAANKTHLCDAHKRPRLTQQSTSSSVRLANYYPRVGYFA